MARVLPIGQSRRPRQAHQRQGGVGRINSSSEGLKAIGLRECCARIDVSYRTGKRLMAEGRFPVPELPRLGRRHRFSEVLVNRYLAEASVADVG